MRGIPSSFLIFFFALVIWIELISYLGFRILIKRYSQMTKTVLSILYFLLGLITISLLLYTFSNPEFVRQNRNYTFTQGVLTLAFLNLFPKTFFAFMTILSYLMRWLAGYRYQLLSLAGSLLISCGIFGVMAYGVFGGRYEINVETHDIYFSNLPKQLEGLKIVQLSDIHLGSFSEKSTIFNDTQKLIEKIQPDLLLFTGDIVNNFSNEFNGFEPCLNKLSARYGKFAILGNHDYGDYSNWQDSTSKVKNLDRIKKELVLAGFNLLLNRWEKVSIKDTSLCIIGVENWGHKPFPQYANLDQALENIPSQAFKILLSHDPAHWEAKVVKQTDIPLTLSGHTHGGQFSIKIAGIEFSPIYFIQKNWGGLYQSGNQLLYVNRGLGTIGFPGRIEMRPEITVLTFHRIKNY